MPQLSDLSLPLNVIDYRSVDGVVCNGKSSISAFQPCHSGLLGPFFGNERALQRQAIAID